MFRSKGGNRQICLCHNQLTKAISFRNLFIDLFFCGDGTGVMVREMRGEITCLMHSRCIGADRRRKMKRQLVLTARLGSISGLALHKSQQVLGSDS